MYLYNGGIILLVLQICSVNSFNSQLCVVFNSLFVDVVIHWSYGSKVNFYYIIIIIIAANLIIMSA